MILNLVILVLSTTFHFSPEVESTLTRGALPKPSGADILNFLTVFA
ncbi:hypothetical protein [Shewanella sp.]|nr:hypothetical protein [Shewanella sp.]NRB22538.1 hypothetical protein [Shewanella sp.]